MLVDPKDIKWEENRDWYIRTINLPCWMEWYYSEEDKHLSVYMKQEELRKIWNISKEEAELFILWAVEVIYWMRSNLSEMWLLDL